MVTPLNILIWHIHGAYLTAITQTEHNWYVPTKPGSPEGYAGRGRDSSLPDYVREIPAEEVCTLDLDLIIFQTPHNYGIDQYEILTERQRQLPAIYIEHNTPEPHPTNSLHPVSDNPNVQLVHVTHYNQLMWDNGLLPPNRRTVRVIEHSVAINSTVRYTGQRAEGICVVNNLQHRGRLAGYDLFQLLRQRLPLTTVGMDAVAIGGLGEIHYRDLHRTVAQYRFLFSPMRYNSLPLAVIEAMTIGMPIIALATTELPTIIENGVQGFVSNDLNDLADWMQFLLNDPDAATQMGQNARKLALERFGIDRFKADWNRAFADALNGLL